MHRFRPALLPDSASRGEESNHDWQELRQAALRILELDSDTLEDAISDLETAETMFWLYEQLGDFIVWHKAELELLETASARLLEVLKDRIQDIKPPPAS